MSPKQPQQDPDKKSKTPPSPSRTRSAVEFVSFLIAFGLVLATLGLAGFLWIRDRNRTPPILEVTSRIESRHGKYYVPFTVTNQGGQTAAAVQVVAELRLNGELVEWGEQEIDFLSSQEEVEGAFIFSQQPTATNLTVRTASYQRP